MDFKVENYKAEVERAVAAFWNNLGNHRNGEGMDGFIDLLVKVVRTHGLKDARIFDKRKSGVLPGYFRRNKDWDLVVFYGDQLIAALELKSQSKDFGNNFNNRVEEALGSSADLREAIAESKFGDIPPPFLGWLMLLSDCDRTQKINDSRCPTPIVEPFPEFVGTSYAKRYNIFCDRLVKKGYYNAASLILTPPMVGGQGTFSDPPQTTPFLDFLLKFAGHVGAEAAKRGILT